MNHAAVAQWQALDGIRGLSIAAVLLCHLVPLGPKNWIDLNIAAGHFGMSLFFSLSGFLIAHKLHTETHIQQFAINRFLRIFPLLWLVLLVDFAWRWPDITATAAAAHALVWVNNARMHYFPETRHLWSVCVEVHFYLLVGLLYYLLRRKGIALAIAIGVLLCAHRYMQSAIFNTTTLLRLDELLIPMFAGLVWHSQTRHAERFKAICRKMNPAFPLAILAVCCIAPPIPFLSMLRPFVATWLLLSLLYNPTNFTGHVFASAKWEWLSRHAYALYLIHPFLLITWLGSGDKLEEYAKRPLLFAVLAILAYLSTRYYERFFIDLGKNWWKRRTANQPNKELTRA